MIMMIVMTVMIMIIKRSSELVENTCSTLSCSPSVGCKQSQEYKLKMLTIVSSELNLSSGIWSKLKVKDIAEAHN